MKLQDLEEDEEYKYTYDDFKTELSSYGNILELLIPRPKDISSKYPRSALLKVFCKYEDVDSAKKAVAGMAKKAFDNQIVKAYYMSVYNFDNKIF